MREIYLDNSATTPICEEAKRKMLEAIECYGNPSSLHKKGFESSKMIDEARSKILASLFVRGGKAENLIFTAGGTEADNLALTGVAYAKARRVNRIITTDSEHSAIDNTLKMLENDGFEVIRLSTKGGVIDIDEFKSHMNKNTLLVSIMHVNNETGAVYNIKECFKTAKQVNPDVVTHTDAVQSYMKMKVSPVELSADLISVSAHKIHGPKGVGALYVSPEVIKKKQLKPIIYGGGQEFGFRSGTENLVGIAGFGAAAERGFKNISRDVSVMRELRIFAIEKLSSLDVRLNLPQGECAPHIINITLPSIKSETMLHHLSASGIYVSSGSACSSNSATKKVSRALRGFGLSDFEADCSMRISFSPFNTKEEIDELINNLETGIQKLVKIK
ncbi:MAG: cysteine desulfurase [Clostridia bacterium]|nr:cysteine desulfurase [Clostridia bacterium]